MSDLKWHSETRKVEELETWARNPRKITKEAFAKLKDRIKARGFHDVIKIDTDGTILSGNQRRKALMDLKIPEVNVLIPNRPLTEEEKDKIGLESNNNDGEWNYEELRNFNFEIIEDAGFKELDLSEIWSENFEVVDDKFNETEELAKITEPVTKLGDLIVMGKHRLICGDATDPKVLKKLFGDERASIVYSDPVFNLRGGVDYSRSAGKKKINYGGNVIDTRTDEEYKEFIRKSLVAALAVTKQDAHVFYWSSPNSIWLIQTLFEELGIKNQRVCFWVKNGQNCTPSVAFNRCYEPCTYGIRGKPYIAKSLTNLNEIMNKEIGTGNQAFEDIADIWTVKRLPIKDYIHATSKPVTLHEKAIKRCSKSGDIILDSFSGSFSTGIAAEQLGRIVYAVELEPKYCDLAIKRFEVLTGKKAKITHERI